MLYATHTINNSGVLSLQDNRQAFGDLKNQFAPSESILPADPKLHRKIFLQSEAWVY